MSGKIYHKNFGKKSSKSPAKLVLRLLQEFSCEVLLKDVSCRCLPCLGFGIFCVKVAGGRKGETIGEIFSKEKRCIWEYTDAAGKFRLHRLNRFGAFFEAFCMQTGSQAIAHLWRLVWHLAHWKMNPREYLHWIPWKGRRFRKIFAGLGWSRHRFIQVLDLWIKNVKFMVWQRLKSWQINIFTPCPAFFCY